MPLQLAARFWPKCGPETLPNAVGDTFLATAREAALAGANRAARHPGILPSRRRSREVVQQGAGVLELAGELRLPFDHWTLLLVTANRLPSGIQPVVQELGGISHDQNGRYQRQQRFHTLLLSPASPASFDLPHR